MPPINVLSMIENVLIEQDPELISHLTQCDVTTKTYVWPLLETAFSEVLTAGDWCVLWDHVLSNEPAFILMAAAAYNVINRQRILTAMTEEQFTNFYHNQALIDLKKLLSKTYELLQNTQNHPRIYLNEFCGLKSGAYPNFFQYPKAVLEYDVEEPIEAASQLKKEIDEVEVYMKLKQQQEDNLLMDQIEQKRLEGSFGSFRTFFYFFNLKCSQNWKKLTAKKSTRKRCVCSNTESSWRA